MCILVYNKQIVSLYRIFPQKNCTLKSVLYFTEWNEEWIGVGFKILHHKLPVHNSFSVCAIQVGVKVSKRVYIFTKKKEIGIQY